MACVSLSPSQPSTSRGSLEATPTTACETCGRNLFSASKTVSRPSQSTPTKGGSKAKDRFCRTSLDLLEIHQSSGGPSSNRLVRSMAGNCRGAASCGGGDNSPCRTPILTGCRMLSRKTAGPLLRDWQPARPPQPPVRAVPELVARSQDPPPRDLRKRRQRWTRPPLGPLPRPRPHAGVATMPPGSPPSAERLWRGGSLP